MEFLVEVYTPRTEATDADRLATRAREAAAELTREGVRVRLERTIFVPGEETTFYLYEANSDEDVHKAMRRAALPANSVVAAVG